MTELELSKLNLKRGDMIIITMNDESSDSGQYSCLSAPIEEKNGYHYESIKREAQPAKVVINKKIKFRTEVVSFILSDIKSIEKI